MLALIFKETNMEAVMTLPLVTPRKVFNFGYCGGTLALCLVLLLSLMACSTTWIVDLETYLPVALAGVTGIVTILASAGALGPVIPVEITAVETAISTGLTLLCGTPVNNQCNPTSLVGAGQGNLARIQAELATLQSNITTFLNLIHIKNAVLQATIGAALSLILSTISAIASRIGTVTAVMFTAGRTAAAKSAEKLPKMKMSASQFKAQLNQMFMNAGYPNVVIP
jgi:hypothetical protein